jgi:RND family efflux transporter MFP subunit
MLTSMSKFPPRRSRLPAIFFALALAATGSVASAQAAEELNGKLVFWRTSKIATPIMGRIDSLPQRVGAHVKKGEVIAKIDTRQLEAELAIANQTLASAKSDLASAEANLKLEMGEYNRLEKLKNSAAFSRARFEDVENKVAVARTGVEVARSLMGEKEAEIAKRKLDVELATIEAPFDGVVVRQLLTVGGLVSTEDPHILILVDDKTPEIEVEVPLDQVSALSEGTEVEFSIGGGDHQTARVRAVMPAEAPGAETRIVRLDPVNPTGAYSDVAPVTIYLPGS